MTASVSSFPECLSPSNPTANTLAAGASCNYAVDFIPADGSTNSGALTLTDDTLNAAAPGYATQSVALSELDVPFGHLDGAVDSVTGSTTVGQSNSVKVTGWVADPVDGAPVNSMTLYIDGNSVGAPTQRMDRPDVAAAYGDNAFLDSGYKLLYSASSLSPGTHSVTAVAINSGGHSTTFGPLSFTVAATAGAGPPFGNLDIAGDSVTGSATISQSSGTLKVTGWVGDPVDMVSLSSVMVYIDGNSVGTPTLNIARPDVAAVRGNAYLDSGFRMLYSASLFSTGTHSVTVVAVDAGDRSTTFGPRVITVQ